MALPDKLPKPAKHPEHITEADWEKYLTAECALAHKSVFGLMSLSEYNLYEAKKEYPDEF